MGVLERCWIFKRTHTDGTCTHEWARDPHTQPTMTTGRLIIFALLCATVLPVAADEKKPDEAAAAPKKPSTLAPTVSYLEAHTFFHTGEMPKVLFLPNSGDDGTAEGEAALNEPPSWLTSAAMAFKDGRVKKASVAIALVGDVPKFARRFSLDDEQLPSLLGISRGKVWRLEAKTGRSGSATLKAAKEFIKELVEGTLSEGDGVALPSFPEPTRPRKKADAVLEEFTFESLPLNCYNSVARPLCVVALYDQPAGAGCPEPMAKLSRAFRNDKAIGFGCVGAAKQSEFLGGLGIRAEELPALLAVKGGRRPRAARMDGGGALEDVAAMTSFVDGVIGGGATFKRLADGLPDLEPPYLLDQEEPKEEL